MKLTFSLVTFGLWPLLIQGHRFLQWLRFFCEQHGYDIHPLKQMLCMEGMGGFSIPYLGYIEAIVRIPPIKDYKQCVPMLVLKSFSPLTSQVPVQLGTSVLDQAMAKIMVEEFTCASSTWWQTYMSTMVTASAAGITEQGSHNTHPINTPLVTMRSIVIPPSVV